MGLFCWTRTGHSVHITDDAGATRCGRPVTGPADADDVAWYWPPCRKCWTERRAVRLAHESVVQ